MGHKVDDPIKVSCQLRRKINDFGEGCRPPLKLPGTANWRASMVNQHRVVFLSAALLTGLSGCAAVNDSASSSASTVRTGVLADVVPARSEASASRADIAESRAEAAQHRNDSTDATGRRAPPACDSISCAGYALIGIGF
jgi:hypothetical protein